MPTEAARRPWWPLYFQLLQHRSTRICLWILVLVFTISLLGLGATPAAVGVANPPWDKLLHFGAYGTLATMVSFALGGNQPLRAIILTTLVGCMDEGLQLIEPGRHAGIDDLLVDVIAAILASVLCQWVYARIESHVSA